MSTPPTPPAQQARPLPVHRSQLLDYDYVYAVLSRRAGGVSLGINLNPDKVCNFDCPYCQIDRTVPGKRKDVDVAQVLAEVRDLAGKVQDGALFADPALPAFFSAAPALRVLRDVAFAGDGEPTSCRGFLDVVRGVAALRGEALPASCHITLITNASLLHRSEVRKALLVMDANNGRVWAKLDAGTEAFYRRMDKTDIPYRRILDNLLDCGLARPISIQSMFHTIDGEPPPRAEIDALRDRLRALRLAGANIVEVQVYTIARRPADPSLLPLNAAQLEVIAAHLSTSGVAAHVYL